MGCDPIHPLPHSHPYAAAAFLFAFALLAAGQSSSIIATVAGQAVSEGFLQWRVSVSSFTCRPLRGLNCCGVQPVVRRLLTRLLGLIPSMIVAIAVGRRGIDALLVASQVVLAITLPFITFPLLYLTSSRAIMKVRVPTSDVAASDAEGGVGWVDFSNGWLAVGIGASIWLLVLVANVYVIVMLILGKGEA